MAREKGPTSRRVGLTTDQIVNVACQMSADVGLEGWSMRALAKELQVVPSVVYHYFPNKDAVCSCVVETVTKDIPLPDASLDWKAWFTDFFVSLRPVLLKYHGVTERLKVGLFPRSFLPVADVAVGKLQEAGFGKYVAQVYAMIVNVAIDSISSRNMRDGKMPERYHDMMGMIERLRPLAEESAGLKVLMEDLFVPLTGKDGDQLSERYYKLILASLLSGIETVILPKAME